MSVLLPLPYRGSTPVRSATPDLKTPRLAELSQSPNPQSYLDASNSGQIQSKFIILYNCK